MIEKKTGTMGELEQRFGEPIEDILSRKYTQEKGKFTHIAKDLGIHRDTVVSWLGKLGIPKRSANQRGRPKVV